MVTIVTVAMILVGFVLLIKGGDLLVEGSVGLATLFRISPMLIGMTIVAFGTSLPELAVSTIAASQHHPGLVLGNIIGSNIANILLILGLTAAIYPVSTNRGIVRRDMPALLLLSLLVIILVVNLTLDPLTIHSEPYELSNLDGGLLVLAFAAIMALSIRKALKVGLIEEEALEVENLAKLKDEKEKEKRSDEPGDGDAGGIKKDDKDEATDTDADTDTDAIACAAEGKEMVTGSVVDKDEKSDPKTNERKNKDPVNDDDDDDDSECQSHAGNEIPRNSVQSYLLMVIGGLVGVILGARLLVGGSVEVASSLGVSDAIVGLTMVAVGSSLPELVTSAMAARKKQPGLILGNIVGSNMFNLFILGVAALIYPIGMAANLLPILAIMMSFTLLLFIFVYTSFTLERWEGGVFLACYLAYMGYVVTVV